MHIKLFFFAMIAALTLSSPAKVDAEEQPRTSEKIPLPGLAVSLGMSVDEVAHQLQHFKFQHIPEKRWQKNGNSFVSPEYIVCSAVSLAELNEQLECARFIFENHILVRVELTILEIHNDIQPLVDKLKLVKSKPEVYRGLMGKIVMRAGRANAEKTTWIIEAAVTSDDWRQAAASPGDWVKSDNRDLAIRLSMKSARIAANENISIIAQIRNDRQKPVTILRPFGDWYDAEAVYIRIWGEYGRIAYSGPAADYVLDAKAFVTLAPNEIVTDILKLTNDSFAGLNQPGTYTLRYDYRYDGTWDETVAHEGVKNVWRGRICSRELQILKE